MILVAVMTVAGVCLGIVLAAVAVPRVKVVPLVSVIVLAVLVAAALFMVDLANSTTSLVFGAAICSSSATYAGAMWKRVLPQLPNHLSWFVWCHFSRPGYLRALHQAQESTRKAEEYRAP